MKDYRQYSFWLETADDDLTPRPAMEGSIDVDVAILGAGYTGLWTAYYLRQRDPSLKVAVLERLLQRRARFSRGVAAHQADAVQRRATASPWPRVVLVAALLLLLILALLLLALLL